MAQISSGKHSADGRDPIKVLIVDDSAIVRKLLTEYLERFRGIQVVGTAPDPYIARNKIVELEPDVLTLDLEMPRMDGLTFLRHLMKHHPLPVVIVSSLLESQRELALEALRMGAVDVVPKPGGPYSVGDITELLAEKIIGAAHSRLDGMLMESRSKQVHHPEQPAAENAKKLAAFRTNTRIIVAGASTGGTSALEILFSGLRGINFPPVAAVIHMPEGFTFSFAARLSKCLGIRVKEAVNDEILQSGTVYIAPGNHQMSIRSVGKDILLCVRKGPKVSGHRPSVDVLFRSAADHAGRNACGIILTGMGRDGAEGLLAIRDGGGHTVAQDEATCIVYGMPRAAMEIGAAETILPLEGIIPHLIESWL